LWAYVEADLQDRGVDVDAPEIRRGRTWRWLRVRIEGLLSAPPQIVIDGRGNPVRVPQSRLALGLEPIDLAPPDDDGQPMGDTD
jgi:hypothetical protein